MAKFRTQHTRKTSSGSSFYIIRLLVYGVVLVLLLWKLLHFFKKYKTEVPQAATETVVASDQTAQITGDIGSLVVDFPSITGQNQLVLHTYFSLSYAESHEMAEWVAYNLTKDHLNGPKEHRFDYFAPDRSIATRSAEHRDYTGSGYSRGHLAPAADMSFDPVAAEECFYMSNISPQNKYFNQGVWRELEECVRDWARRDRKLYVVTGPVLTTGIIKKIGRNRVSVPSLFYKVILDIEAPEMKGIGLVLPNASSDLPLSDFMISIDSVEHLTGIDFFNATSKNQLIETLEKNYDKNLWPIDQKRHHRRVEEW